MIHWNFPSPYYGCSVKVFGYTPHGDPLIPVMHKEFDSCGNPVLVQDSYVDNAGNDVLVFDNIDDRIASVLDSVATPTQYYDALISGKATIHNNSVYADVSDIHSIDDLKAIRDKVNNAIAEYSKSISKSDEYATASTEKKKDEA